MLSVVLGYVVMLVAVLAGQVAFTALGLGLMAQPGEQPDYWLFCLQSQYRILLSDDRRVCHRSFGRARGTEAYVGSGGAVDRNVHRVHDQVRRRSAALVFDRPHVPLHPWIAHRRSLSVVAGEGWQSARLG